MKPIHTKSYSTPVTLQIGAKGKPTTVKADETLALSMTKALQGQGDGRISAEDEIRIAKHITDGGLYGAGEKDLARAMMAARDDRKHVFLQVGKEGKKVRLRLTDPAEVAIAHDLRSFWGHLGAEKSAKISAQAAQKIFAQLSAD